MTTVVRSVGTPKIFADLARPTTLLMTLCVSWLRTPANWNGWWSIRIRTLLSGVSNASRPAFTFFVLLIEVPFVSATRDSTELDEVVNRQRPARKLLQRAADRERAQVDRREADTIKHFRHF